MNNLKFILQNQNLLFSFECFVSFVYQLGMSLDFNCGFSESSSKKNKNKLESVIPSQKLNKSGIGLPLILQFFALKSSKNGCNNPSRGFNLLAGL